MRPGTGSLTRQEGGPGIVSESGVLGDATLATREKGQVLVETLVAGALEDIEAVRNAPLPAVEGRDAAAATAAGRRHVPRPAGRAAHAERLHGRRGTRRSGRSARGSARSGARWTRRRSARCSPPKGTCAIPTARSSAGGTSSWQNRLELFRKKEYRGSVHPLQLNDIRCLAPGMAIADGKWELRLAGTPHEALRGLVHARPSRQRRLLAHRGVALHGRPAAQHHAGADDSEKARLAGRPGRRLSRVRSAFGSRLGSGLDTHLTIADLTPMDGEVPF